MTNPTIIIIAYNRPRVLQRLLKSIATADYILYKKVRLVISIDGGGDRYNQVLEVANTFNWPFGEKEVISHNENIGLRQHVIDCGNLTEKYENIIVLEEDCFVGRNFYDYACKSLEFYKGNPEIAGISLYAYTYYESAGMPFMPVNDGFDTYFMQVPGSLGQVLTKDQWLGFMDYYKSGVEIEEKDKLPEKVKTWPKTSWKKYYYKYMVEKNLYFVYPQMAFSTNFGDAGTNLSSQTQVYQVPIENYRDLDGYRFCEFVESLNKYDAYFELLPACLIAREVDISTDTCIDLIGSKPINLHENKYWLSGKRCMNPIISFDNSLIPVVQNVIFNVKGNSIHYAERESFGIMDHEEKIQQIANAQSLGFTIGEIQIISGKYYKIGYYITHPLKIPEFLKRKLLK